MTPRQVPRFDRDSLPFWEGCALGELRVQRCRQCDAMRFPPLEFCPFCHDAHSDWVLLPGSGWVQSFVVVHRAFDPHFAADVPYVVAMIQLDGAAPPIVLPGFLRDLPIDQVRVGVRVRVEYERYDDTTAMAVFVPSEKNSGYQLVANHEG